MKKLENKQETVSNGAERKVQVGRNLFCITHLGNEERDFILRDAILLANRSCIFISVGEVRRAGFLVSFETDTDETGICKATYPTRENISMIGNECKTFSKRLHYGLHHIVTTFLIMKQLIEAQQSYEIRDNAT